MQYILLECTCDDDLFVCFSAAMCVWESEGPSVAALPQIHHGWRLWVRHQTVNLTLNTQAYNYIADLFIFKSWVFLHFFVLPHNALDIIKWMLGWPWSGVCGRKKKNTCQITLDCILNLDLFILQIYCWENSGS